MASAFSHIAVPLGLGGAAGGKRISVRLLCLGIFLSAAPDLDSLGFRLGVSYDSQWGHRGFTHSIVFAVLTAFVAAIFSKRLCANKSTVFIYLFFSMVSHGILDALTTGGRGVAFFWPFENSRYFLPWKVIEVSPISISRFFSDKGLSVLRSEFVYIWMPMIIFGFAFFLLRRICNRRKEP